MVARADFERTAQTADRAGRRSLNFFAYARGRKPGAAKPDRARQCWRGFRTQGFRWIDTRIFRPRNERRGNANRRNYKHSLPKVSRWHTAIIFYLSVLFVRGLLAT